MFPLLRYFSLTSALAVIAVTVALVVFYRQSAISGLVASAEAHNASMARSFANTIWPDYAGYVSSAEGDGDGLRQRPETGRLHAALATLTEGLPVLKVKIYNLEGLTVYSSQASQIGEDKSGNRGFLTARGEAKSVSKLSFRDSFSAFSGLVEDRDLVETYVPIARGDGTVEGVFELYTDVTPLVTRLERAMTGYIIGFLLVSALLYGVLFVIVRRADGILKGQHLAQERNEESIQAKNVSLEQEIEQRQTIEAALRAAKEDAETANRAKSEFLATVSHEVRTPMNGVLGMAGLMLDSDLGQQQREYAEVIRESGEALMTVINDILDFSKIEVGKVTLEQIDFDLVQVVDHILELLGPQAKGIELAAYVAPNVPRKLRGDDGRIRQILLNLIGNALKFTKQGSVAVEVTEAEAQSSASELALRFAVRDTGIGVPPEARDRIFCEFTQADSSTTRSYGGTGLGLAICRKLVTLMGGEIGLESGVDRGSTFWFTVPFKREHASAEQWTEARAEPLRGRRVLVAAGDDAIGRILERQLTGFGMAATVVADGETALASLRTATADGAPIEIAIIDHLMADGGAAALADRVRRAGRPGLEALILLSSPGQIDSDPKAQETGFDATLPRPLRPAALLGCLERVLNGSAAVGKTQDRPAPKDEPEEHATVIRILLAEDNVANQKVIFGMLANSGFRVDTVANGLEVIEALENRPYDLVLMDVGMPEMNGIQAARAVRGLDGPAAEVPIIAVTAHAMDSDQKACFSAGMNDFIAKPIQRTTLIEKLDYWLGLAPKAESGKGTKAGPADGAAADAMTAPSPVRKPG